MINVSPTPHENHTIHEMLWKNIVQYNQRYSSVIEICVETMRLACRITKIRLQTHTHSLMLSNTYCVIIDELRLIRTLRFMF